MTTAALAADRADLVFSTVVEVDDVSKTYGRRADQTVALDGVSLRVRPGEFLCLVGGSGCGKSTLLSLLAGLDQPTSGTVRVNGGRPALMFQDDALLPWLSAGRNVELALKARGLPRRGRRAEAQRLLQLVRLPDHQDKRVHELSGGMRQRVALARALGQGSHLLLMDEPFAALDAITRDGLHKELIRLWQEEQLTVVFVTHNVREAVRLADRVVLMSARPGRVVRDYAIAIPQPRRIEAADVAGLALRITDDLAREVDEDASL